MKKYFAGVDIGTTGVKTIIVDENGEIGSLAYREYPCEYPNPGWVEQDVNLIWKKVCECTKDAVSKINEDKKFIKSMGLSSQRGTFIPVDEKLQPLMNSIVWSDARAYKELLAIKKQIGEVKYKQITGVPLSGLWSYAKIKWLINNKPDIFDRVFKILNGQEYFLYKFGSDDLQTDPSSLTLNGMLDIAHLDWSSELCHEIGLPINKLPPVNTPCREVGKISTQAAEETGFPEKMSIAVGGGDQQCAAIGSGIIREGMAEMTIGTAMVMVAHIENLKRDEERKVLMGGSAIPKKCEMEGI